MEMKQGIEEVKRIFGEYTSSLNKIDSNRVETLLRDYEGKLVELLYEHGIDGVGVEEIMEQIKEEIAYDKSRFDEEGNYAKKYNNSEEREEHKIQFDKEINNKMEEMEQEENEERQAYIKSLPYKIESLVEEGKRNSTNALANYLEDFFGAANGIVFGQLNRAGYYSFEDFEYDFKNATRQIGERNLYDYESEIGGLNREVLQLVSENLDNIEFVESEVKLSDGELDVESIRKANRTLMEEMQIDSDLAQAIYKRICY